MSREAHVRVCEGLGVKVPRATRLTGSEGVRAPVIPWLNRNWATHFNPHILWAVLSMWSETTCER